MYNSLDATYAAELSPLGLGYPLWQPSGPVDELEVELGDVGYIHDGSFHYIFNAFRPATDLRNQKCGVPDEFVPLFVGSIPALSYRNYIEPKRVFHTGSVKQIDAGDNYKTFECAGKRGPGAVLVLEQGALRHTTRTDRRVTTYVRNYVNTWHEFVLSLDLDLRLSDIRLVTGYIKAPQYAIALCQAGEEAVKFRYQSIDCPSGTDPWERIGGEGVPHFHYGPKTPTDPPPANQCVFVNYCSARRRLLIPMRIVAAAGPHRPPPANGDDCSTCKAEVHRPVYTSDPCLERDIDVTRTEHIPIDDDPGWPHGRHASRCRSSLIVVAYEASVNAPAGIPLRGSLAPLRVGARDRELIIARLQP
ncbi:uncharacterized protein C8Q71DRAFT_755988 [Rhodofomes roseus]|uniref:Dioxygenase n=1 Tax=Rhodofomes roseus TaxID=34475 RepID=A0ABQ8KJV6_9APHY|nr:uncharacterized protein C8Q71DRAFT_755988 [Rhodofomes roseus]KAH9838065.1 hypothetical protein C8Q71DRAFT_755988 [Rhodofomes roseus]